MVIYKNIIDFLIKAAMMVLPLCNGPIDMHFVGVIKDHISYNKLSGELIINTEIHITYLMRYNYGKLSETDIISLSLEI